ncbi:Glycosyltransferase involved in cell wall bisynthesis [Devosia crocina]|uniref:Glycosyltransferase involved in cell wall bisynthesis n=1 Tax=Devosia crocina TaxID=429728 RepID=A0A1I7MZ78_9HYPH|nr:glycosyltransferase family 4 protein [Devosia crocina]SFV27668.1 Glycosyltransferase involved in cell wall bisynthesis [Devosia crocina]
MKILVIAPACDGTDVGESWVAHQWVAGLSRSHEVTLLTSRKRNRPSAVGQLENVRIREWIEPPLLGRAERLNSMLAPGYVLFYVGARRWIRNALRRGEQFDVAFQPVPVAMRYPSPAAGLGVPLVVGPVGGGLKSPAAFAQQEGTDPWFVRLRGLDEARLRFDGLLRRTYESADCVLGIAPYVSEKLRDLTIKRLEIMSETAILSVPAPVTRPDREQTVRALFVGRLVRTKGAREAIRALALCADLPLELDIVGAGPDGEACTELARNAGVLDRVRFHGAQPRDSVSRFYRNADIFVFPSYREPGGNVTLEAMSYGLPVIVCDRGGPGNAVSASAGFRLPVTTPDALANDVADAMRQMVLDPALRRRCGEEGYAHVQRTALWDHRLARMETIFADLVAAR